MPGNASSPRAVAKQDIEPDQLTLHADRGSSMRSKPVGLLLANLWSYQDGPLQALRLERQSLEGAESRVQELERSKALQTDPLGKVVGGLKALQRVLKLKAVYFAQRPQHPAPPAQTLPKQAHHLFGGSAALEQNSEVAGCSSAAIHGARRRLTPRSGTRGGADARTTDRSPLHRQSLALDESYRGIGLHGS